MLKRLFKPAEGVSNIELFYDLIFVYGINVVTSLCHQVRGDFLDLDIWLVYLFSFLVILQVWFYTTLLLNRYGDRSLPETIGLFINMFLLYFLANGVRADWSQTATLFNLTWAGILVNLAVQWFIKLHLYTNLDNVDRRIMKGSAYCLIAQAAISAMAAFLPELQNQVVSWIALLFGMTAWTQSSQFRKKPARFNHVTERCSLLTIIAFGEMIVGISYYMVNMSSIMYPIGVFALTVGLFVMYIFEHDNMLDHHAETDGMAYITISLWLIIVIGNLTVAVEFMPMDQIAFMPKSIFLSTCLVLYLLTSFMLGKYNKPEFHYSVSYTVGRLAVCAFVIIVGVNTSFDPAIGLACHVIAVYIAIAYEWYLWRKRSDLVALGSSLGMSSEEMIEAGFSFTTLEGRRDIVRTAQEVNEPDSDEG